MSKTHRLKIVKEIYEDIKSGEKTFEIRLNDRGYQKGDLVYFYEHGGDFYQITYVMNGYGLKNGYVVFSFKVFKAQDE